MSIITALQTKMKNGLETNVSVDIHLSAHFKKRSILYFKVRKLAPLKKIIRLNADDLAD